ncbi:MAG: hypothetical protein CBC13_00275 [Planctomycetia bacterium TMED53]|nr:MAG: hypothetical protein CBC13_00275 [Planctomycetia bacterium TMED53]
MIFRFPRRIFGLVLIISGMVIFEFPDIIQYALAGVLVFSGVMMLLGSFAQPGGPNSQESAGREAEFRKLDE